LVVLVMMKVHGPLCVLQEVASAAVDEGCRQQWLARLAYQDGRRWQLKVRGSALNLLGCREPALGPLMVMKVQGVVLDLLLKRGPPVRRQAGRCPRGGSMMLRLRVMYMAGVCSGSGPGLSTSLWWLSPPGWMVGA